MHSVLTQHMRSVDICTATETDSTSLKHITPLCCCFFHLITVSVERIALYNCTYIFTQAAMQKTLGSVSVRVEDRSACSLLSRYPYINK